MTDQITFAVVKLTKGNAQTLAVTQTDQAGLDAVSRFTENPLPSMRTGNIHGNAIARYLGLFAKAAEAQGYTELARLARLAKTKRARLVFTSVDSRAAQWQAEAPEAAA